MHNLCRYNHIHCTAHSTQHTHMGMVGESERHQRSTIDSNWNQLSDYCSNSSRDIALWRNKKKWNSNEERRIAHRSIDTQRSAMTDVTCARRSYELDCTLQTTNFAIYIFLHWFFFYSDFCLYTRMNGMMLGMGVYVKERYVPVSWIDPCCFLINVINIINFSIKIGSNIPPIW